MSTNTLEFVIHAGLVYEADDWHNSHDADRYDDILSATVDLNHPDCPDGEQLDEELSRYWEKGIKPSYVIK